jgi:hypothetical protein
VDLTPGPGEDQERSAVEENAAILRAAIPFAVRTGLSVGQAVAHLRAGMGRDALMRQRGREDAARDIQGAPGSDDPAESDRWWYGYEAARERFVDVARGINLGRSTSEQDTESSSEMERCGWRGMAVVEKFPDAGCVRLAGHEGGHGFSDGSGERDRP